MASLLDLTVQGDVATISDESKLPQIKLMGPLELYRLWERQNWVSHEIDLELDKRDWAAMDEELREEMLWGLSAFFVGEERVTNQFSGLVLAAESRHEEAFLISQQVDQLNWAYAATLSFVLLATALALIAAARKLPGVGNAFKMSVR